MGLLQAGRLHHKLGRRASQARPALRFHLFMG